MGFLRRLLNRFLWIYDRENGDSGIVIAVTREEAIKKLMVIYPDTERRIKQTDEDPGCNDWMYLYDIEGITVKNDVYVTYPA